MINLLLQRGSFGEYNTRGELYNTDDNTKICDTLELSWRDNEQDVSCIPPGSYTITPYFSAKLGKCLLITNVVGRTWICCHTGNYASSDLSIAKSDTQGCILVGNGYSDLNDDKIIEIIDSRVALKQLLSLVTEPCSIEIKNAKGQV